MAKAIKVENLSKAYQIGEFSTGTLSRDIERWWALARGKEDPFLKIGETNVRSEKGESNVVWSLKDLNFEVEQGEAIGIIGKNGAGKSTLLKVLSQVTTPTTGTIKMKGRVASLLEVGTGFHPELTGRENIYLNGAILGMKKAEVKKKFDEIVDFSGVNRYIDTPVKRYSSGMHVRLAFAVAAHLDSEILIVDEVLAVGDAEFQKKCIGKMGDISKGEGRTILFVSHVLTMIKNLCSSCILLSDGTIKTNGFTNDVLKIYEESKLEHNYVNNFDSSFSNPFYLEIIKVEIRDLDNKIITKYQLDRSYYICVNIKIKENNIKVGITLILRDPLGNIVFSSICDDHRVNIKRNKDDLVSYKCKIPGNLLNNIIYTISLITYKQGFTYPFNYNETLNFKVYESMRSNGFYGVMEGAVRPKLDWEIEM